MESFGIDGMTISGASAPQEQGKLLAALALAMVERPRATLQELAKAVGVSKATLYRFCRTREQLVERLLLHATSTITEAIRAAELTTSSPLEGLSRLNANSLEHRELSCFLVHYWKSDGAAEQDVEAEWEAELDAFFLHGQQAGVFRIDVSAPALTEIWVSVLIGIVDAERRGRIARAGITGLFERIFLNGAAAP